jgi:magnesium-transporting ATPase (P-type)
VLSLCDQNVYFCEKYLYLVITALTLRTVTLFISFFSQYICPFFLLPFGCPFYGYFFGYAVFFFLCFCFIFLLISPNTYIPSTSQLSDIYHLPFSVIRPKTGEAVTTEYMTGEAVPTLAPPPKSPVQNTDITLRFNPFDKSNELVATAITASTDEPALPQGGCKVQICRISV